MDAKEYDRIADLLMQIRKKYKNLNVNDEYMISLHRSLIESLDTLMGINDVFAKYDSMGWL